MYKISANTSFIGKSVIYMPSCHSTNDHVGTLLSQDKNLKEGTIVLTPEQTKGRGQRGNTWESNPNENITASFLLRPQFITARNQFQLNVAISLGVFDTIHHLAPSGTKIKWPNDILVKNKKVGGILIENFIVGQNISHSIIGIGLNINQESFVGDFPATSLFMESNKKFQVPRVIETLLENIENRYLMLKNEGYDRLRQEYYSHLFWYHETGSFQEILPNGEINIFEGQILGVNENGCLSIGDESGKIRHFGFKEVKHLY
ncbi:biotin--[acetyl-CoA-carboxylase] ligase [Flammeovirga aprica]|uniref:Biotin--[acetyl-CoA-carboxylase] ligase n=1 Tax=Flammeovirga aprica JL-4 TaxID=694437 RepID=A0A7X9NYQ4_9BACT|nr:biotin--[acetyl-CoA-carboxylase] ligase [Flammeovirga aprica]NME66356.1 biotin--[acetyl-CoA-carboxylase] ligase [Flammeovirga aprica JL-4]